MKKAYLVTYSICTRVIVDSGNHGHPDDEISAHLKAKSKLQAEGSEIFTDRFIYDNAEVSEDVECPYDEDNDQDTEERPKK